MPSAEKGKHEFGPRADMAETLSFRFGSVKLVKRTKCSPRTHSGALEVINGALTDPRSRWKSSRYAAV